MSQPSSPADVVRAVAAGVSRLRNGKLTEAEKRPRSTSWPSCTPSTPTYGTRSLPWATRHCAPGTNSGATLPAVPGARRGRSVSTCPADRASDGRPRGGHLRVQLRRVRRRCPFNVPCIFVVRVRDGLIVESRDYADHVGFARAFGRIGALAAALAS